MARHRKDTPKRSRRPIKASEVAMVITALGTFLVGLAAVLAALIK